MDSQQEMLQALHEHGILDHNANTHGSSSKQDAEEGIINIHLLWLLYKKVVEEQNAEREVKNREMEQLQKYVEDVRHLSEERDQLTIESEKENNALKQEIKRVEDKRAKEEQEIIEMFYQESLSELIGKSRSEQIACLLMFRTNLTEKLETTEKDLRSEDSELRDRMNDAMSEMGGMANKLNEAIQERDRLKREVAHLSQTLAAVNALPAHNINNMEAKTQIESLQHSVNYYVKQIERLTAELETCKSHNRSREAELNAELQEMKEMNARYKDVNVELNNRLNAGEAEGEKPAAGATKRSASVDSYLLPESHERLQEKSKLLINQMQATLESEERQVEVRDQQHKQEIKEMEGKLEKLENELKLKEEQLKHEQETRCSEMELRELKAQLAETDRQCKETKAESLEYQEKYHKSERDAAKSEAAWNRCQKQLNTQNEINFSLKGRNTELEMELSKVLNQLQSANEKHSRSHQEHEKLEEKVRKEEERIENLKKEISELKSIHKKELNEVKEQKDRASKVYVSSENKRVSDMQIQLTKAQTDLEREKAKRLTIEEDLESLKFDLESVMRKKNELMQELEEIQKKNASLERKLQMMSGKYEDIQGEKLVAEMSREQLEDITKVLNVRLMSALDKCHAYSEKYRSLKQKHKGKIRQIRDLFTLERMTTAEEVEKLELRVTLAESALERELSWKQQAIDEVRRAEEEQRKAIEREDEARKSADDKNIELSRALDKNKDLNDENEKLMTQLSFLERQKQEMERIVRRENQKKELSTLLSSLSLSGSFPRQPDVPPPEETMDTIPIDPMMQDKTDTTGTREGRRSIKRTDL